MQPLATEQQPALYFATMIPVLTSPLTLSKAAGAQIPCLLLDNWKYTEYAEMRLQDDITL